VAFQFKKNVAETTNMICSALGEGTIMHETCKKWYPKSWSNDFCLTVKTTSFSIKNVLAKKFEDEALKQLLDENPAHFQNVLTLQLGVTWQSISICLYKLEKIYKLDWWIPHELSPENTQRRIDTVNKIQKEKLFVQNHYWRRKVNFVWQKKENRGLNLINIITKSNIHAKKVLLFI